MNTQQIRMVRGQTYPMTITVRDQTGAPKDLTGAKAYFAMRADAKVAPSVALSSDAAIVGTGTPPWRTGIVVPDQTVSRGQLTITLVPNDTKTLVALGDSDPWIYDVWLVEADGTTTPIISASKLALYPEVTVLP